MTKTRGKVEIPAGVQCFVGAEARRRRAIEEQAVRVFEGWDYEEIIPPLFDYADVFAESSLRDKTYSFVARDGSVLALRPDFTGLMAKLAAGRLADREPPIRLYYSGEVLRWEPPKAGRQSELYQMGLEHLGGARAAGDVEVLAIACEMPRVAGRARLRARHRPRRSVRGAGGRAAPRAGGDGAGARVDRIEGRRRRAAALQRAGRSGPPRKRCARSSRGPASPRCSPRLRKSCAALPAAAAARGGAARPRSTRSRPRDWASASASTWGTARPRLLHRAGVPHLCAAARLRGRRRRPLRRAAVALRPRPAGGRLHARPRPRRAAAREAGRGAAPQLPPAARVGGDDIAAGCATPARAARAVTASASAAAGAR